MFYWGVGGFLLWIILFFGIAFLIGEEAARKQLNPEIGQMSVVWMAVGALVVARRGWIKANYKNWGIYKYFLKYLFAFFSGVGTFLTGIGVLFKAGIAASMLKSSPPMPLREPHSYL